MNGGIGQLPAQRNRVDGRNLQDAAQRRKKRSQRIALRHACQRTARRRFDPLCGVVDIDARGGFVERGHVSGNGMRLPRPQHGAFRSVSLRDDVRGIGEDFLLVRELVAVGLHRGPEDHQDDLLERGDGP